MSADRRPIVVAGGVHRLRRRLGPTAWFVLEGLLSASHGEAARCRSTATVRSLAADLGMSKDTVARALARLSAAGIVVAEQQRAPAGTFATGSYSHETAAAFGDDAAVHRAVVRTTTAPEVFSVLIPEATRGLPARARLKSVVSLAATGSAFAKRHDIASCEAARAVARRIGLSENVSTALHDVHECWNGRGARRLKGDQIALAARVARVATEAVFLAAIVDADMALPTLRRFAGRRLDPDVTAVFTANAPALYAEASSGDGAWLGEVEFGEGAVVGIGGVFDHRPSDDAAEEPAGQSCLT